MPIIALNFFIPVLHAVIGMTNVQALVWTICVIKISLVDTITGSLVTLQSRLNFIFKY